MPGSFHATTPLSSSGAAEYCTPFIGGEFQCSRHFTASSGVPAAIRAFASLKFLARNMSGNVDGPDGSHQSVLKVSDLRRVVEERVIIAGVSFEVSTGEILSVRGPSGVGKSLLLRSLALLDPISVRGRSEVCACFRSFSRIT